MYDQQNYPEAKFRVEITILEPGNWQAPPLETPEAIIQHLLFFTNAKFVSEMFDSMLLNYLSPESDPEYVASMVNAVAAIRKSFFCMEEWREKQGVKN